jgi:hypothetical protein
MYYVSIDARVDLLGMIKLCASDVTSIHNTSLIVKYYRLDMGRLRCYHRNSNACPSYRHFRRIVMIRKTLVVAVFIVIFAPLFAAIGMSEYHSAFHTHQRDAGKSLDAELRKLWLSTDSYPLVAGVWYDSDHAAFIGSFAELDRCWMQEYALWIDKNVLPVTIFSPLLLLLLLPGMRDGKEEKSA